MGEVCLGEIGWGYPCGMCGRVCAGLPEAEPCPAGSTCQPLATIGVCYVDCTTEGTCPQRSGCGLRNARRLDDAVVCAAAVKKRPLIHIIDGSGYIFRAYYAIRPLTTARGEPTNAAYGFATMIDKALREENPTHLAITFDAAGTLQEAALSRLQGEPPAAAGGSLDADPAHSSDRGGLPPADLQPRGLEADDTIATLVRLALEADYDVRLITGDKDLFQLVSDRVTVFEPMKNQRFGKKEVEEKMGVPPELVADALALAGDSTDNIPGVKGVGLKTAAKLLLAHGGLDAVLEAAKEGKVKGKMGQNLVASEADARLSRKLVALDDQVKLSLASVDELAFSGPDQARLRELYTELEFKRLIPKLAGEEEIEEVVEQKVPSLGETIDRSAYRTVETDAQLDTVLAEVGAADVFAFWVRDGDDPGGGYAGGGRGALGEEERGGVRAVPGGSLREAARRVREPGDQEGLRGPEDRLRDPRARGRSDGGPLAGTTIAAYLLEPDEAQYGPVLVSRRYIGHDPLERDKILGTGKKAKPITDLSAAEATPLLAELADIVAGRDARAPAAPRGGGGRERARRRRDPAGARARADGARGDPDRRRQAREDVDPPSRRS